MVNVVIHIGIPKTGTSTIQHAFHTNRVMLRERGLDYADIGLDHVSRSHIVLAFKGVHRVRPARIADDPDEAWDALAEHIRRTDDTVFLSSEEFAVTALHDANLDVLSSISNKLKGANIKIIGYVRRQDDCIESTYKQGVKTGHIRTTIEEFIDESLESANSRFNYRLIFDRWAEVFRAENVEARIYDRRFFVQGDLVKDIFHAIDRELPASFKILNERRNPSIGAVTSRLFVDLEIGVEEVDAELRKAIRRKFDNKVFEKDCFNRLLSSKQRNLIMQKFEASNKTLIDKYVRQSVGDALAPGLADGDANCFNVDDPLFSYEDLLDLARHMRAREKSLA